MKLHYCPNYETMSQLAHNLALSEIKAKSDALLGLATGSSPIGLYAKLKETYHANPTIFKDLNVVKLDEWCGIPMDNPASCEWFLKAHVLDHWRVSKERYISFNSDPKNLLVECRRVHLELQRKGPIDLCILGLGANGHLGFNEPLYTLVPFCHVAALSKESLQHQMIENLSEKPKFGLTLGMAEIVQSHKIILLVTGNHKDQTVKRFLSKEISTHLPASFLWLHNNADCILDTGSVHI